MHRECPQAISILASDHPSLATRKSSTLYRYTGPNRILLGQSRSCKGPRHLLETMLQRRGLQHHIQQTSDMRELWAKESSFIE